MSSASILKAIGPMEGVGPLLTATEVQMAESPGLVASCLEFAAEGLWLTRRIDKDQQDGTSTYGSSVTEVPEH
jgi:magnesium chelatase subunit I